MVDEWDRRITSTLLAWIMKDKLLEEAELAPYADKGFSFKAPPTGIFDRYMDAVERLGESPRALGMHPNTEIGWRSTNASQMMTLLLEVCPLEEATVELDKDQISTSSRLLAKADEKMAMVLEKVGVGGDKWPGRWNMDEVRHMTGKERKPWQNVFIQEMEKMCPLCRVVDKSLHNLKKALDGECTLSESLEQLVNSLA